MQPFLNLKTTGSEWLKPRLTGAMLCVLVIFGVLSARLFYLQVLEGEEFRRLSENNCIRLESLDAPRGLIYDRYGQLLVDNRPAFNVHMITKDAQPVDLTLTKLARHLNAPVAEFATKLAAGRGLPAFRPILLSQDIGRTALAAVEVHRYDLPGIEVTVEPRRNYIHKESASHLLGYLSEINPDELKCGEYPDCRGGEFIGKFGVEKAYGSFLRGKRGGRQVEVDARGRIVRVLKTVEAQPGHNLYLTIDQRLQAKAEALLTGVVGAVVAMDPNTGELLALASSPSFDQNDFVGGLSPEKWKSLISNPYRPMENKALQGEYPPASTFKIVTASAGLEEGVIDAKSKFYCPGHYRFGNRVYRCWKKGGHGSVDVVRALAESCDVFFYQVGEKLGVDRIAAYAKAFGLGSPTGTNLDREARGLVPTAAWKKKRTGIPWQRGETLSVAIGQGYDLATPLQMAVLTSAIANGGIRYRPSIVKEIRTAQEEVLQGGETQVVDRVKISKETLNLVQRGLWEVVNTKGGTARIARVEGLAISGKTGTAQVFGRKKNEPRVKDEDLPLHLRAHAWFVAYAPSDKPSIAVSVIVEHGEHGSSAAAPIARELIKFYLVPEAKLKPQA